MNTELRDTLNEVKTAPLKAPQTPLGETLQSVKKGTRREKISTGFRYDPKALRSSVQGYFKENPYNDQRFVRDTRGKPWSFNLKDTPAWGLGIGLREGLVGLFEGLTPELRAGSSYGKEPTDGGVWEYMRWMGGHVGVAHAALSVAETVGEVVGGLGMIVKGGAGLGQDAITLLTNATVGRIPGVGTEETPTLNSARDWIQNKFIPYEKKRALASEIAILLSDDVNAINVVLDKHFTEDPHSVKTIAREVSGGRTSNKEYTEADIANAITAKVEAYEAIQMTPQDWQAANGFWQGLQGNYESAEAFRAAMKKDPAEVALDLFDVYEIATGLKNVQRMGRAMRQRTPMPDGLKPEHAPDVSPTPEAERMEFPIGDTVDAPMPDPLQQRAPDEEGFLINPVEAWRNRRNRRRTDSELQGNERLQRIGELTEEYNRADTLNDTDLMDSIRQAVEEEAMQFADQQLIEAFGVSFNDLPGDRQSEFFQAVDTTFSHTSWGQEYQNVLMDLVNRLGENPNASLLEGGDGSRTALAAIEPVDTTAQLQQAGDVDARLSELEASLPNRDIGQPRERTDVDDSLANLRVDFQQARTGETGTVDDFLNRESDAPTQALPAPDTEIGEPVLRTIYRRYLETVRDGDSAAIQRARDTLIQEAEAYANSYLPADAPPERRQGFVELGLLEIRQLEDGAAETIRRRRLSQMSEADLTALHERINESDLRYATFIEIEGYRASEILDEVSSRIVQRHTDAGTIDQLDPNDRAWVSEQSAAIQQAEQAAESRRREQLSNMSDAELRDLRSQLSDDDIRNARESTVNEFIVQEVLEEMHNRNTYHTPIERLETTIWEYDNEVQGSSPDRDFHLDRIWASAMMHAHDVISPILESYIGMRYDELPGQIQIRIDDWLNDTLPRQPDEIGGNFTQELTNELHLLIDRLENVQVTLADGRTVSFRESIFQGVENRRRQQAFADPDQPDQPTRTRENFFDDLLASPENARRDARIDSGEIPISELTELSDEDLWTQIDEARQTGNSEEFNRLRAERVRRGNTEWESRLQQIETDIENISDDNLLAAWQSITASLQTRHTEIDAARYQRLRSLIDAEMQRRSTENMGRTLFGDSTREQRGTSPTQQDMQPPVQSFDVLQGEGGRSAQGFDTQAGARARQAGEQIANPFENTETYPDADSIVERMDAIYTELDSIAPEQMGASGQRTEALAVEQIARRAELLRELEQAQRALRQRIPASGGMRLNMGIDPTQLGSAARAIWRRIRRAVEKRLNDPERLNYPFGSEQGQPLTERLQQRVSDEEGFIRLSGGGEGNNRRFTEDLSAFVSDIGNVNFRSGLSAGEAFGRDIAAGTPFGEALLKAMSFIIDPAHASAMRAFRGTRHYNRAAAKGSVTEEALRAVYNQVGLDATDAEITEHAKTLESLIGQGSGANIVMDILSKVEDMTLEKVVRPEIENLINTKLENPRGGMTSLGKKIIDFTETGKVVDEMLKGLKHHSGRVMQNAAPDIKIREALQNLQHTRKEIELLEDIKKVDALMQLDIIQDHPFVREMIEAGRWEVNLNGALNSRGNREFAEFIGSARHHNAPRIAPVGRGINDKTEHFFQTLQQNPDVQKIISLEGHSVRLHDLIDFWRKTLYEFDRPTSTSSAYDNEMVKKLYTAIQTDLKNWVNAKNKNGNPYRDRSVVRNWLEALDTEQDRVSMSFRDSTIEALTNVKPERFFDVFTSLDTHTIKSVLEMIGGRDDSRPRIPLTREQRGGTGYSDAEIKAFLERKGQGVRRSAGSKARRWSPVEKLDILRTVLVDQLLEKTFADVQKRVSRDNPEQIANASIVYVEHLKELLDRIDLRDGESSGRGELIFGKEIWENLRAMKATNRLYHKLSTTRIRGLRSLKNAKLPIIGTVYDILPFLRSTEHGKQFYRDVFEGGTAGPAFSWNAFITNLFKESRKPKKTRVAARTTEKTRREQPPRPISPIMPSGMPRPINRFFAR